MAKQWDANTCPQCKNAVGHLLFLDSAGQVVRKEALPAHGKAKALSIGQVVTPALQFNNAGWYWTAPEDGSQRQSAINARHAIAWDLASTPPPAAAKGKKPGSSIAKKMRSVSFRNTAERVRFVTSRLLKKASKENIFAAAEDFGIQTFIRPVTKYGKKIIQRRSPNWIAAALAEHLTGDGA